jgi:hypothetical protein
MSDLLFDAPYWLPTLIALVGVVVFIDGNRRAKPLVRNAGIAIFLLSIVLLTLKRVVNTDSKTVTRQSHELIDSVVHQKWDAVSNLLEPNAVLTLQGVGTWYRSGAQIVDAAKSATSTYPLDSTAIESLKLDQAGTEITATLTLLSAVAGQPVPSSWQLVWVKDGDNWRVSEIDALQLGDRTGPDMGRDLPQAPR